MIYPKINGLYKRFTEGPFKNQFMDGRDGGITEFARNEFGLLYDNTWVGTEKIDGTNIRVYLRHDNEGDHVAIKGRSDNAQIPADLLKRLEDLFVHDTQWAEVFNEGVDVTLYGEGYGDRIQKVGSLYNPHGVDFILFDIRIGNFWLVRSDVNEIAEKLGILSVPVVFAGTLKQAEEEVKKGFHSEISAEPLEAEGMVLVPLGGFLDRGGNRIITKLKARDYR